MHSSAILIQAGLVLVAACVATAARAQCPAWSEGFHGADLGGHARAAVVHDDGTGPALHVGGEFVTAGTVVASNVARWNGASWSSVGSGTGGRVQALCSYDDGSGPALYAAGIFTTAGGLPANRVARWDGAQWTPLGSGLEHLVQPSAAEGRALFVHDDGSGPALYVGGAFTHAGGVAAPGLARWNGSAWSAVGGGVSFPTGAAGTVSALTVYDDGLGGGPQLVVAGWFTHAGGALVNHVARWNGGAWSGFGTGIAWQCCSAGMESLAVYDEGSGPRLFVGGAMQSAGGVPARAIARWDGASWSALPGTFDSDYTSVTTMLVYDDGSGAKLWAGGNYFILGPPATFARWDGSSWSSPGLANGIWPRALCAYDDGSGLALYAGGNFNLLGTQPAGGMGRFDGASWAVLEPQRGLSGGAATSIVFDDGSGPELYLGGSLTQAGGSAVSKVARFDGTIWTDAGGFAPSISIVYDLEAFDDGSGPALYAGVYAGLGSGTCLYRRTGLTWSPVGGTFGGAGDRFVSALAVHDDGSGPALYVGGRFTSVGGVAADRIARWDGLTWSPLGAGTSDNVYALAVWDDGGGPALYAGGLFVWAGGVQVERIARWSGGVWSALGAGVGGFGTRVNAIAPWDSGSGPALYIGGNFTLAGGAPAAGIASWDGSTWAALGAGVAGSVSALLVHDEGPTSPPALYAGGAFATAGGVASPALARWDGSAWSALGDGLSGSAAPAVNTLCSFGTGSGAPAALFAAGVFLKAGDTPSSAVAAWIGCGEPGVILCAGDGSGAACPCGNHSPPGDGVGCLASNGSGARLRASGVASLANDTLVLSGQGMPPVSTALYFQGTATIAGGAGIAFGDGLRCAAGTVVRIAIVTNAGGASQVPQPGGPALSSYAIGAGAERTYQIWYRDAAPYCTASTFNLSNGLRIAWAQ